MSIWKNASAVFLGGTEQMKQLKGRRVRVRTALQLSTYDPIFKDEQLALAAGTVGIIANPHPTLFHFLIAFPTKPGIEPTTLERLTQNGNFKVVIVNEPTFKRQFDIES